MSSDEYVACHGGCGKMVEERKIEVGGKWYAFPTLCEDCAKQVEYEAEKKDQKEWEKLCPPLYRSATPEALSYEH